VIFDFPEINIENEIIKELMATHDVFISTRPKSRQSTMCVVIKGIEKFITNIYDARHDLLRLTSDRIVATIPQTYYGPHDKSNFKNSAVAQLVASSMTYSSMSPLQIPQIQWPGIPTEMSWRSQIVPPPCLVPTSPLTTSMLHQHNQMINMQIPGINVNNLSELHTSGYSTFPSDNSVLKSQGSSQHSSPENYANKYNQSAANYMDSAQMGNQMNDSMSYALDPRIVAGLRAISTPPQQGETRTPTSGCKCQ
jgi:hypothetical protein